MNKKGQIGLGVIMIVFISVLVGVVLFQVVAQQVGTTVNTVEVANESLGAAAVDGTVQYLTDYRALSDVVVYNATGDVVVPADNYTIANNVVYNGALAVSITPGAGLDVTGADVGLWQVSGTAQPLTYVADSGSRAITSLIVVFFALMIVAAALYPIYEGKLMELLGK